MAHFDEQTGQLYDWNEGGVYVVEREDPVDGGLDGVSNRQGRELTRRTRNLHGRLAAAEGEIDTLQEELPIAAEAAKRSAIEHTDGQVAAVRDELALGDQAAINAAKAYADRIVAALVDNSPELLNTLEELASALGGDPNFATTVMQAIGERATNTDFNAHTASGTHVTAGERNVWNSKAAGAEGRTSGNCNDWITPGKHYYVSADAHAATIDNRPCDISFGLIFIANANGSQLAFDYNGGVYVRANQWRTGWSAWRTLYHSGNINPIREGETVLSGEASAVVFENTGTGETGSRRASLLLKWHNQFAGVSVLRGGASEVQGLGININNEIVAKFLRGGMMIGTHTAYHSGNLKIIRGSVTASGGNGGGNADSIHPVAGEGAVVRITHNLNTHTYSATAATVSNTSVEYTDNVVSAWRKTANYVDFVVTRGPDNSRELCAFDFIIIPH